MLRPQSIYPLRIALCTVVFATALACTSAAQAQSLEVQGTELTPQFITQDGAIFVYHLRWRGWKVGGGIVQVDHAAELPTAESPSVPVVGGAFALWVGWFGVVGDVVGGEIATTNNPDIYSVTLLLLSDDDLPLTFEGSLDHRPLLRRPPRLPKVSGELFAAP
jgi:hypothetical protein